MPQPVWNSGLSERTCVESSSASTEWSLVVLCARGYLVSSAPAELLVRRDTHRRVELVQQRLVLVDPLVFLLLLLPLHLGRVGNWGHPSALDAVLLDEVSARGRIV